MSWLDRGLEDWIAKLGRHGWSDRQYAEIISALHAAYEGGFEDGAGDLEATRALLKDAAHKIAELSQTVELLSRPHGLGVERSDASEIIGGVEKPPELNFKQQGAPETATENLSDKPWPSVGTRVRSRRGFAGVPRGTEGVVDADYDSDVMVAWDLPDRPLPPDYGIRCMVSTFKPPMAAEPGAPLRDGFDKRTELDMLEEV